MNTEQLTKLLLDEIRDIYHAEKQLVRALPKMAKACEAEDLADALEQHLAETQNQVGRLERVFQLLKTPPKAKTCKGMQGLVEEGAELTEEKDSGAIRDLGIIGAAQRIEHYEISAYGTARAVAEQLGHSQVARLLQQTEEEEKAADEKLSEIARALYGANDPGEEEEMGMAGNGRSRAKPASRS